MASKYKLVATDRRSAGERYCYVQGRLKAANWCTCQNAHLYSAKEALPLVDWLKSATGCHWEIEVADE